MASTVTVVLIHWNQPDALHCTVARFAEMAEVGHVIVVDNGSTEENRALLAGSLDASVTLIDVGFNSGFGPAANRGLEHWLAHGDNSEWCVVAPHDALPRPDTIEIMLDAAREHSGAGLLSADVGDSARPIVDHVFGPILLPAASAAGFEHVDYPHGTLMMASRSCLTSIGLFDERFFAYCEEADLGLRAKKAGFEVGLVRGAVVENPAVSSATPVVEYLMERNTILLIAQHFGRRKAAMRWVMMVGQLVAGSIRPQRRTPYWSSRARRRAIADVVREQWGPPPAELTRR